MDSTFVEVIEQAGKYPGAPAWAILLAFVVFRGLDYLKTRNGSGPTSRANQETMISELRKQTEAINLQTQHGRDTKRMVNHLYNKFILRGQMPDDD